MYDWFPNCSFFTEASVSYKQVERGIENCAINSQIQAYSRLHIMMLTLFCVMLEDNQVLYFWLFTVKGRSHLVIVCAFNGVVRWHTVVIAFVCNMTCFTLMCCLCVCVCAIFIFELHTHHFASLVPGQMN